MLDCFFSPLIDPFLRESGMIIFLIVFLTPYRALSAEYKNFLGMTFVDVPVGSFFMGSCRSEQIMKKGFPCNKSKLLRRNHLPGETPMHKVILTKEIQFGISEVTIKQFIPYINQKTNTTNHYSGATKLTGERSNKLPITSVSWYDVQNFIAWVNELKPDEDRAVYRLPTEAEWEYASGLGRTSFYFWGNKKEELGKYAWYAGNTLKNQQIGVHEVENKLPNEWSLYDMYGNVGEWVSDWYQEDYYSNSAMRDPIGPDAGVLKVVRGGAWNFDAVYCRTAVREFYPPDNKSSFIGFRLVRELKK